uniref:C2H2-type domain-containing protein n=1 Tax=Anguilla anguilla TaxID=7936 RepID=A0A0E9PM72_ANGAN
MFFIVVSVFNHTSSLCRHQKIHTGEKSSSGSQDVMRFGIAICFVTTQGTSHS